MIEVTTLADDFPAPAGSLRACTDASGPRTCVFRVGGIITLKSGARFEIKNPYLTIAGQTAPGGGILITGGSGIVVLTHDVIIRYLRSRLLGGGNPGSGQVNIGIRDGSYNVIVDHCSTSWSLDENVMIWKDPLPGPDLTNVTVQRCLIAEGLAGHSTGLQIGGEDNYGVNPPLDEALRIHEISVHHNLFVHNYDRNPRMGSNGSEIINNVVYNWGSRVGVSVKKNIVDLINNYWKPGPMSQSLIFKHESTQINLGWVYPDPSIYIAGNVVQGSFENPSDDNWQLIVRSPTPDDRSMGLLSLSYRRYTPLAQASLPITIESAASAYISVLADAGANARLDCQGNWIPNSDAVDIRVVADVQNGTGWSTLPPASPAEAGGFPVIATGTPCTDSDNDGMPNEFENLYGFNANDPSDNSKDADGDGYTNVEEYLNGTKPTTVEPQLALIATAQGGTPSTPQSVVTTAIATAAAGLRIPSVTAIPPSLTRPGVTTTIQKGEVKVLSWARWIAGISGGLGFGISAVWLYLRLRR